MKTNSMRLRTGAVLAALVLLFCLTVTGCGKGDARLTDGGEAVGTMARPEDGSGDSEREGRTAPEKKPGEDGQEQETGERSGKPENDGSGSRVPVYGTELQEGVYPVTVDSSSSMFRITECRLTVRDGAMEAVMTMSGTGYLRLYMGTGAEAESADASSFIPYQEQADGTYTFTVPVEALDQEIPCSAFSRKKERWYDRILVFRSDSLPEEAFAGKMPVTAKSLGLADGVYLTEVTLEGGSGRASVESPARLSVENGAATATIVWGSANYDYMLVDGEKFIWEGPGEHSTFEIPVSGFDRRIPVIADTLAMGTPHEVSYTLTFHSASLGRPGTESAGEESGESRPENGSAGEESGESRLENRSAREQSGESRPENGSAREQSGESRPENGSAREKSEAGRQASRSMELRYAQQFSVEYLSDGNALVTIQDTGKYLVVAEGGQVPGDLPGEITVIWKPVKQIYLAATSAMDLFCSLESIDTVTLSGTDASGWYIPEARKAMEAGDMVYAGKYNAPDYERILAQGCDLAIESTMITHSPEVKEQLEALGIPVLVERSSYESHPLGRMEWLKLYGLLLDKEALADQCLDRQRERLEPVMGQEPTGRTVAFFYITSNGSVNVRRPGDYVAKLIHLAGGTYVPGGLGEADNAQSTMNMQMEAFYGAAKDADVLIYNGAIDQAPGTREELLAKSPLLADFRGVKEGRVWCTEKNLFQETMGLGELLLDIHRVVTEERPDPEEMTYLKLLQ